MSETRISTHAVGIDEPDQYTRCPFCVAVFRVDQAKLLVRNGEVRCGACREIFDATENIVVKSDNGTFSPYTGQQGIDDEFDQNGDNDSDLQQMDAFSASDSYEEELPDSDLRTAPYFNFRIIPPDQRATELANDAVVDRSLELQNEINESKAIDNIILPNLHNRNNQDTESNGHDDAGSKDSESGKFENDQSADPLFLENNRSYERIDSTFDLRTGSDQSSELEVEQAILSAYMDSRAIESDSHLVVPVPELVSEPENRNWFDAEPDPLLDNNPFSIPGTQSELDDAKPSVINMSGVDEYIIDRPNPLLGVFWFLVSVGFLALLGLQVKHYYVEKFAQDEKFRPALSMFCRIAKCTLPPRRDPYRFTITNTRIDLHPQEPGALRITVKLLNQAEFAQQYPDLELTLTDRLGRVVGRRNFDPEFYLSRNQANQLKPGDLGSVEFDLVHPHEKAVGFVVNIVREPSPT